MKLPTKTVIWSAAICVCITLLYSCDWRDIKVDKTKLIGVDIRHFQGTNTWEIAKAVDDGNISKVKRLIEKDNTLLYSTDSIFGMTLLMHAVHRDDEKMVGALLELGADPNIYSDSINNSGKNAVLIASFSSPPSILKLLLDYGGDPNSVEKGTEEFFKRTRNDSRVPIISASSHSYEKVKMLVETGADVNKRTRFGSSALRSSITFDQMDIAMYLFRSGADVNMLYTSYDKTGKTFKADILWALRKCVFPIGSKQHKTKMEIVAFLKEKGLDYFSSPIPENIEKQIRRDYPDDYENMLSAY